MKQLLVRAERAALKIATLPELRPVERQLARKAIARFAGSSAAIAILSVLADHFLT